MERVAKLLVELIFIGIAVLQIIDLIHDPANIDYLVTAGIAIICGIVWWLEYDELDE